MKKLFFILTVFPAFCFSQKVIVKGDTLFYRYQKYYVGKELQLGRGSSNEQNFSFIFWGLFDDPANPIDAKWADTIMEIEKIYNSAGRYYLKCHAKGVINKFHIDVQDAMDHQELK